MGMDLFDDSGDDDVEKLSKIEINKEFAKRYEHNKKREDLQRFEELKKKGLVDDESDDESESDSDDVDDEDDDVNELLDGLLKIRNKDPSLMEKDAKLFESDDDEEEENGIEKEKKEKKKKPKYLKDVNAQHLLEEGPEFDDEDEDEKKIRVKSYAEEQEDLRRAVLDAMEEAERENDDDDGDLFKFKENEKEKINEDGDVGGGNEEFEKKLDAYFGEEDENEKFLKEFLRNKMWIDKGKGKRVVEDDDLDEISDDEEALEKQEDYEREYNFRFEEGVSDRVLGHSRVVDGSVRKETNARKQQRERKKERLAQAEIERREEVKRLKNLKKREIQERLDRIREIAGVGGDNIPLSEKDLEEDFDPDEFDKKMKAAFGDEYYEAEDAEFGSDLERPDFEKEDELLGLSKDWDVIESSDGDSDEEDDNEVCDDDDENGDELEEGKEGKKKRKRKLSLKEKVALDKELEELYKLDYEDAIGDLKTRFKYREVAPRKYGLSAAHILWSDDKELNRYVSLKNLAPYREKEYTVPRMLRRSFMLKKGALLEAAMNRQMGRKKRRRIELGESSKVQPSNDESKLSRAAKRRRRQKEKKLPQSRLAAYGKIPYSSKKKSKS